MTCARIRTPTGRLPGRLALVATLSVLSVLGGCARKTTAPAESAHLIRPLPGTVPPTYTLADETRPVLATPREWRLHLDVDRNDRTRLTFPLPEDLDATEVVATGLYQRGKFVAPLPPQRLRASTDRTAVLPLEGLAAVGFGEKPPGVSVVLTALPTTAVVESTVNGVTIPPDAELRFAFGLSDAARLEGAAPIELEIVAVDRGQERHLFSTTLDPHSAEAHRWQERTLPLGDLAGRTVGFVFRARTAGDGPAVLVPLWGDPTIVAPGIRPPTRRNVILISLDTLRADRVGVYGAYRPTTPSIDALASRSVVFTNAWSVWPETCGSHMSLFTSRYPSQHGVTNILTTPAASVELLGERLRRDGYLTRAFTENGNVWAHAGFARGFSAYTERRSADRVYRGEIVETFGDATRWLETHADRTFFLFVHTYEVHTPYEPPAEYATLFADIPARESGYPNVARDALLYDRETRFTDVQVGKFVETIERLGLADKTIVIILSDHGEEFGEHGFAGHMRSLYREALHVPLIIWAPGLLAPARIDAPANLIDIPPTVLDLLELPADGGHHGVSLAAAARGAGGVPDDRPIFGEFLDRLVSVRQDGRTAIMNLKDGATTCYGADDPGEQRPLASCPDLAGLIAEHRATAVPVGTNRPAPPIDPRMAAKMRALGYLE
jgi:arylsulfatase A-like enzyme